jgi:hypothetical protein
MSLKISFENRTGGSKVAWHWRQRDFAPLGTFIGAHVDPTLQVRAPTMLLILNAGNQIVWRDTQLHAFHTKFCGNQSDQIWHAQYGDRISVMILRNYGTLSCVLCIRRAKQTHTVCYAVRIFDPSNYFVGFDECWLLWTLWEFTFILRLRLVRLFN